MQREKIVLVIALLLVTALSSNSIDQALSKQQNAFAQGNDIGTTFPQIHNFTSTPPAPVNSWIIESKNGVVIIDTQRTLHEASNALDKIKELDKPILGVIISHPHPDHIGGTEVLLNDTTNVPIYSTQLAYDIMKNDTGGLIALAKQLHGAEYPDQVILPNRIIQSGENVTIDGIAYNFEDIGPGEGGDMMLTYLPEQKLLFTGDVVNNQMHPVFIEGHSTEWTKQIEDIK
jgi:glyoxylase-like metal-dependent hydrolase (beta-lactamase superfamily II)